jgi:Zn-dependent protease with chaperone function
MTGVLTLLLGSTLVGLYGHRPLLWLAARSVDPTILLTGWILSAIGLVVTAIATLSLFALPADQHSSTGLFRLAGGCWTALSSGYLPGWREGLAALSVAGAVTIVLRICSATTARRRRRRNHAPHLDQLRLLAASAPAGEPLWVRDNRPLALSFGGSPGLIVMSDALRERLTPQAMAATLEHERAHLRGRHHALVALVETLATALPMVPLLRGAPSAIRDLIELSADAQAARRCGPAAVREALSRLTGQPTSAVGLAMAGRLTQTRLLRLASGRSSANRTVRATGCVAVALAALALPAAAGWLTLNVVGCVVA